MLRDRKIIIVLIVCVFIVSYGFIKVNNNLAKQGMSNIKIAFTLRPFDFRIDYKDYSFIINKSIFSAIKGEENK